MQILRPEHFSEWLGVLQRSVQHDFYHLPGYHAQAEARGEGQAMLFVHTQGEFTVALPLLLRAASPEGLRDATSVYGYAGPVSSHRELPDHAIEGFQQALHRCLSAMGVVAVFSRLHPLIAQGPWLQGLGHIVPVGPTVSIDLTLPAEAQWARFRENHRRGIHKLQRQGLVCREDSKLRHLDEFVSLYQETMRRVGAGHDYFFERDYFEALIRDMPSADPRLFVVLNGDTVLAGGLFVGCAGIVQYHLGGTRSEFLKLAPMKLVFEVVRQWAMERGHAVFHLGGGVGAQEDSLFHFKAGFSERRHRFTCWRWVVDETAYADLCQRAGHGAAAPAGGPATAGFFPAYRSPSNPATALQS